MRIRSIPYAAKVESAAPPFDTLTLRVFYPALDEVGERELETGLLRPDPARAPFPVVIFFPGVNCSEHTYHWLAIELAARGLAVVTFTWVAENLPGRVSLTPGLNRAMLTPEAYGTGLSATTLPAILAALQRVDDSTVLAGSLDLNRIVLGGHSAGGMMALMNADPRRLPPVVAAFSYCASPLPTLALGGWPPGVIAPLPSATPLLMLGATEDGIGDLHNRTLGLGSQSGADTIAATFEQAVTSTRGDAYLAILRGANHHSICHPRDDTLGRTFADSPATADEGALRELLASLIRAFISKHVLQQASTLEQDLQSELIVVRAQK
jgi:pimeloyl-ACP methyl ester carboxylesterase